MRPKHIDTLTWLRGIAALFVVISHTLRVLHGSYGPHDAPVHWLPLEALDLGDFGVTVFFALSGCTLYLSSSTMHGSGQVLEFYARRIARIWPAFGASLLIYAGLSLLFTTVYPQIDAVHWLGFLFRPFDLHDIISYLSLTADISGPERLFNPVYWSLPVEFQYYLLFPLLLLSIRMSGIRGPLVICTLLYLIGWLKPGAWADYRVFSLAFTFGGGMLCGHLFRPSLRFRLPVALILSAIIVAFASLLWHGTVQLPDLPFLREKFNLFGLLALLMVFVALHTHPDVSDTRSGKFLLRYGTISYGIYLYHTAWIAVAILVTTHFRITGVGKLLVLPIALVGSYALATISYDRFERPVMHAVRRRFALQTA